MARIAFHEIKKGMSVYEKGYRLKVKFDESISDKAPLYAAILNNYFPSRKESHVRVSSDCPHFWDDVILMWFPDYVSAEQALGRLRTWTEPLRLSLPL